MSLALRHEGRIRDVWAAYSAPAANVDSRDVVGQSRETARHTGENSLRGSIAFVDVPAGRAGARSIARVNRHYWHTGQPRLVLDKGAKLKERPAMQRGSLSATSRYPFADTLEVFEGNPATGVLRDSHDALADRVVGVGGKPALFAGQLLEAAARRLCALALQPGAQAAVTVAHVFHGAAAVDGPVAVSGDVDDAQVHAQEVVYLRGRRLVHFADLMQVERAAPVDQIRLALHKRQQGKLALARDERNSLPPVHRPNGNGLRIQSPRQDTFVIGDAAVRVKRSLPLAVELVGVRDLRQQADGHLRGQLVSLAHGVVASVVQIVLAKGLGFPSDFAHEVRCRVRRFQCAAQQFGLPWFGLELDLSNQFHAFQYSISVRISQALKGEVSPSSPRLKAGVSGE